jgi:purine-binding chemotaxis protein CheW
LDNTLTRTDERLSDADDITQMIGFILADEFFCVDILMVQEILKNASITTIPDSPNFIVGVINLRGNIIPVIDLCKRLNLTRVNQSGSDAEWIIILKINERVTGFVVDRVTSVLKVPEGAIQPPPDMVVAGMESQFVSGVCKLDNQVLAILDFNSVLAVDEFRKTAR